jgi:hypothetical protein
MSSLSSLPSPTPTQVWQPETWSLPCMRVSVSCLGPGRQWAHEPSKNTAEVTSHPPILPPSRGVSVLGEETGSQCQPGPPVAIAFTRFQPPEGLRLKCGGRTNFCRLSSLDRVLCGRLSSRHVTAVRDAQGGGTDISIIRGVGSDSYTNEQTIEPHSTWADSPTLPRQGRCCFFHVIISPQAVRRGEEVDWSHHGLL